MKRLRWSLAAAADLDEIAQYLFLHHPAFAQSTILRLYDATKQLKRFPRRAVRVALRARGSWCLRRCPTLLFIPRATKRCRFCAFSIRRVRGNDGT